MTPDRQRGGQCDAIAAPLEPANHCEKATCIQGTAGMSLALCGLARGPLQRARPTRLRTAESPVEEFGASRWEQRCPSRAARSSSWGSASPREEHRFDGSAVVVTGKSDLMTDNVFHGRARLFSWGGEAPGGAWAPSCDPLQRSIEGLGPGSSSRERVAASAPMARCRRRVRS